jgi:hypothetical protein
MEVKLARGHYVWMFFFGLISFGILAIVMYWRDRSSLKTLDDDGLTLRNGRRYAWTDLKSLKAVYMAEYGEADLRHLELAFPAETVLVFPDNVQEPQTVVDFVAKKAKQLLPIPLKRRR